MIKFERYSHINDLIEHYIKAFDDKAMEKIMKMGVASEGDATVFSTFVWKNRNVSGFSFHVGKSIKIEL